MLRRGEALWDGLDRVFSERFVGSHSGKRGGGSKHPHFVPRTAPPPPHFVHDRAGRATRSPRTG